MKNKIFKIIAVAGLITGTFSACTKKLDLLPTNDVTSETVYKTYAGYKQGFAKVYASYAQTGDNGPASSYFSGFDPGTTDFFRLFFKAQVLSTDEAVLAWGDPGLQDFHKMNWSANNPMIFLLYSRSLYQITLANEFIRQSADAKLSARGISGADADNVKKFRTEARFLRAFQYWVLMDVFGNPPLVTDADAIGGAPPKQIKRADLFVFIENELKAIEPDMAAPKTNEYGRADKAAVWALLARMYLNAGVYTGTTRYTDAITYAKKVIAEPYTLVSDYRWLMLADNHQNTNEFILTINYDGVKAQTYGGTTFLTHASVGGTMSGSNYGINGGWFGLRTTKGLVNKFPDNSGLTDKRAQFYQAGQNLEINDLTKFEDGFAVTKFRNVSRTGVPGQNQEFMDVDMPLFRLGEMYLIYAEAVLRNGTGGDATTALGYVNALRTRAFGNTSGNIIASQLTLDFILDERARELYWEGHRRTDLIRYDRFVEGTYLWPWKGAVSGGAAVDPKYKLYPIPSDDLSANPNLVQNPGY